MSVLNNTKSLNGVSSVQPNNILDNFIKVQKKKIVKEVQNKKYIHR